MAAAAGRERGQVHGGADHAGQRLAGQRPPGAEIRTTVANPAAERFPDLVRRQFKAEAPGRLLVADFTYLALAGGGFAYVAFVIDAYAGTIRGWECSLSKTARFIQRAIRQAITQLARLGHPVTAGAIHHSDAGCNTPVSGSPRP